MSDTPDALFTVGHSTHAAEAFVQILEAHRIAQVADVRLIPTSRRHPQFSHAVLAPFLAGRGITYRHFQELGGRRRPRRDSVNTAWRVEAFRGYADYMGTDAFRQALEALLTFASSGRTVLMCAEAVWWQCHRRLLADALVAREVPVLHLLSSAAAKPHELSEFARTKGGEVIYPGLL